jgi:hypothetical protein
VAETGLIGEWVTRRASIFLALGLSLGWLVQAEPFPYRATVASTEDLTQDTKVVRFRLADAEGFRFTFGQHTFLDAPEDYVREWNRGHGTTQARARE